MEQVVAQWWHPVASSVALDMLNWTMLHVLRQCLHMAIEMACVGGAFVHPCRLFCLIKYQLKDHVMIYIN